MAGVGAGGVVRGGLPTNGIETVGVCGTVTAGFGQACSQSDAGCQGGAATIDGSMKVKLEDEVFCLPEVAQ